MGTQHFIAAFSLSLTLYSHECLMRCVRTIFVMHQQIAHAELITLGELQQP